MLVVFSLLATFGAKAAVCTGQIGDLAFGSVDSLLGAAADTAASVRIDCVQVTPGAAQVVVCLHLGAGSGGAVGGVRQLVSGGHSQLPALPRRGPRELPGEVATRPRWAAHVG